MTADGPANRVSDDAPLDRAVTLSPRFFAVELDAYSDWRQAFWRELLQNAVDAGAGRVDVAVEVTGGGVRVVVADDGHGMSREVAEDVFFVVGETTKHDGDTVGGYGRARMLVCFPQRGYEIRSGHMRAVGRGGAYRVETVDEAVDGARFTIDTVDDDDAALRAALQRVLSQCALPAQVRLDGRVVAQRPLPRRARRRLVDDDGRTWARVYVDRGRGGQLLVRVRGLVMYRRWLRGDDDVVVELEPRLARDVLASSRDRLRGAYADQLDWFVDELTRNRRRALRPPAGPLDVHVAGGGFLASAAATPPSSSPAAALGPRDGAPPSGGTAGGGAADAPGTPVRAANDAARERLASLPRGVAAGQRGATAALGFDVFLFADTTDARVNRLARAWNPAGWDKRTGRRRRALLLAWRAAVGHAVDVLLDVRDEAESLVWTVGIVLDPEVRGSHRRLRDGHVFAVNPVGDGEAIAYRLGRREDRRRLVAVALHEVAHALVDGHDEDYASVLTDLVAASDADAADREVRAAASRA